MWICGLFVGKAVQIVHTYGSSLRNCGLGQEVEAENPSNSEGHLPEVHEQGS